MISKQDEEPVRKVVLQAILFFSGALRSFGNPPTLSRNIVTFSHRQSIISTVIDNV